VHPHIDEAKKEIPSLDKILQETWEAFGFTKSDVENNFSNVLVNFDIQATALFRQYEKNALQKLALLWLNKQPQTIKARFANILQQEKWEDFVNEASQIFVEFGLLVQEFEKVLGNMRKARGGRTFEKAIWRFLQFIEIPSEIPVGNQREALGRIDIVIPSVRVASETPDRAIFLTCKRTLRERWKQEVPQARLNQRIYLLTIDVELSESKADEIQQKGLIAFVRDEIQQHFFDKPWIRKLSDLPQELARL